MKALLNAVVVVVVLLGITVVLGASAPMNSNALVRMTQRLNERSAQIEQQTEEVRAETDPELIAQHAIDDMRTQFAIRNLGAWSIVFAVGLMVLVYLWTQFTLMYQKRLDDRKRAFLELRRQERDLKTAITQLQYEMQKHQMAQPTPNVASTIHDTVDARSRRRRR